MLASQQDEVATEAEAESRIDDDGGLLGTFGIRLISSSRACSPFSEKAKLYGFHFSVPRIPKKLSVADIIHQRIVQILQLGVFDEDVV